MDNLTCHFIYVNRGAREDQLLRAGSQDELPVSPVSASSDWQRDQVRGLVQPLLDAFGDVHVCSSGEACLAKLLQLQDTGSMVNMTPTIVLLDMPHNESVPESCPTTTSTSSALPNRDSEIHTPDNDLYGLPLLQRLITEAHLRSISKLVVPIPVISYPENRDRDQMTDGAVEPFASSAAALAANRRLVRRCLDLGAVDVLISPLNQKCITTLEICAYKAHRDASRDQQALFEITKGRKRSWVGVNEQKPFAYLREAMVSGLMNGICRLSPEDDQIVGVHIAVSSERKSIIADAVGSWHFCAHSFTDDELLFAAMVMFKHALSMPELEHWRIPADSLISFLVACRAAYNSFVPYHNFRHVVDVLQATFDFLVQIGALPPYPLRSSIFTPRAEKSPIAALITPPEALTLLITAIGHDVGHPGVNNGFLTTLNAPLAQLYNDRSVLESFHCAAYSQILRRYWPPVFEDRKMRNLMISSILATDMGLHFDYMKRLGALQEKMQADLNTSGWNSRQIEEHKILACSLLIKCADISNVARHYDTAIKWMNMLAEEFSRQASMEDELEITSSLMAPPKKDFLSLANAQLGFMNMFAIPLFQGVADVMPAMAYTVEQLQTNKRLFEGRLMEENAKERSAASAERTRRLRGSALSPKAGNHENAGAIRALAQDTDRWNSSTDGTLDSRGKPSASGLMDDLELSPAPSPSTAKSGHDPHTPVEADEVNGIAYGAASSFDAVRELADSDPFSLRNAGDYDEKLVRSDRHACNESREGGGASNGYAGDWASHVATGKSTLSPVGSDSVDRTRGLPSLNMSPLSIKGSSSQRPTTPVDEEYSSMGGSIGRAEGKSLKKRPSRFKIRDFSFFRRNKGSSPPLPAADATG